MNKIDYLVQKYSTGNKVTKPERMAQSAVDFFEDARDLYKRATSGNFLDRLWTRWTADDQSDAKTFDEAYSNARKNGSKTFIWNNKHYSTDYSGEHHEKYEEDVKSGKAAAWEAKYPNFTNPELRKAKQEELDTYGITNEQTKNRTWLNNRFLSTVSYTRGVAGNVFPFLFNYQSDTRKIEQSMKNNDFVNEHNTFVNYLFGIPISNNMLKISNYRQPNETDKYYYTFSNHNPTEGMFMKIGTDEPYNLSPSTKDFLKYTTTVPWKDIKNLEHYERLVELYRDNPDKSLYENAKNTLKIIRNFTSGTPLPGNYLNIHRSLGEYTIGVTPEYISYGDKWNLDPFGSGNNTPIIKFGKSFDFYDRFYKDKKPNIDSLYNNFQWKKQ